MLGQDYTSVRLRIKNLFLELTNLQLDIPQVDVLATKQTEDGKFIITVESRRQTTKCGVCQKENACNYGHGQAVRLRHLPILGQETYIIIQPRRAQCPTCLHHPTTTQTLKWYDQRSPHTKAYDQHLLKQLIGSTVADVSLKENLGYDAVMGALERQVDGKINVAKNYRDDFGTLRKQEMHRLRQTLPPATYKELI